MSLASIRQHLPFFLKAGAIFTLVAVLGPLVLVGFLLLLLFGGLSTGPSGVFIAVLALAGFALGWLFLVLWLANRGGAKEEGGSNG